MSADGTSPSSLWDESDASSARRRAESQWDHFQVIAKAKEHRVIPELKGDDDEDVASAPPRQHLEGWCLFTSFTVGWNLLISTNRSPSSRYSGRWLKASTETTTYTLTPRSCRTTPSGSSLDRNYVLVREPPWICVLLWALVCFHWEVVILFTNTKQIKLESICQCCWSHVWKTVILTLHISLHICQISHEFMRRKDEIPVATSHFYVSLQEKLWAPEPLGRWWGPRRTDSARQTLWLQLLWRCLNVSTASSSMSLIQYCSQLHTAWCVSNQ